MAMPVLTHANSNTGGFGEFVVPVIQKKILFLSFNFYH